MFLVLKLDSLGTQLLGHGSVVSGHHHCLRRALGSWRHVLKHPPSWSGHHRGGVPDRSASRLGRRAISAMFHRNFELSPLHFKFKLLTSTCTRRVEVPHTPTLIHARRAGSKKSRNRNQSSGTESKKTAVVGRRKF